MAKTILNGYYIAGSSAVTLHTHPGRLLGVLVSNGSGTVQTVTFYDDTSAVPGNKILVISVPADESPFYIQFPRDAAIAFDTALHVTTGTVGTNVWSVDHG